ncbi:hypothetical protein [Paenibacillus taichungensis]
MSVGLTILGLSSVFGIFASSFHTLLIARIAQSAGAGSMAELGLINVSMGFMLLFQFFGDSFSVAVCGMLLTFQDKFSLVHAYKYVYVVLTVISICSLIVLLRYYVSGRKQVQSN